EQTVPAVRGVDREPRDPAAVGHATPEGHPVVADPGACGDHAVEPAREGGGIDAESGLAGGEVPRRVRRGRVEAAAECAGGHRAVGGEVLGGEIANRHAPESMARPVAY